MWSANLYLTRREHFVVTVATPAIILSHFPFYTGELSSISSGAHGRGASTESRRSVEEESTPPLKRKCTRDEDIMAAIPGIESVQPYPYFPLVGVTQASCSAIHVSIILGTFTHIAERPSRSSEQLL